MTTARTLQQECLRLASQAVPGRRVRVFTMKKRGGHFEACADAPLGEQPNAAIGIIASCTGTNEREALASLLTQLHTCDRRPQ